MNDTISRQAAIDNLLDYKTEPNISDDEFYIKGYNDGIDLAISILATLPSAEPERDIPVKPVETTDRAWGIPHKQAVCPKCDYYLGHVAFLDVYKGKRITYCETCGQAIDWEGWKFDD